MKTVLFLIVNVIELSKVSLLRRWRKRKRLFKLTP